MTHLEQVAERQADPNTLRLATRRSDAIFRRLKAVNVNAMATALQDEPTPRGKVIWLNHMIQTLHKATEGLVPCKAGCSHCCHMATNITQDEAKAIADFTGRTALVPDYNIDAETGRKLYEGKPCPFLVNDQCSVYEVRPMPCRTHFSVDKDNLLCKIIPGESIRSPTLNTMQFQLIAALAHDDPLSVRFADIREYF